MPNDKPFYLCWVDHHHKYNDDNCETFSNHVPTVRHYSLEEAKAEAKRLCQKHGHPVYPLRADGCYRPVKPCPVEWVGDVTFQTYHTVLGGKAYRIEIDGKLDLETTYKDQAYARYRELGGTIDE